MKLKIFFSLLFFIGLFFLVQSFETRAAVELTDDELMNETENDLDLDTKEIEAIPFTPSDDFNETKKRKESDTHKDRKDNKEQKDSSLNEEQKKSPLEPESESESGNFDELKARSSQDESKGQEKSKLGRERDEEKKGELEGSKTEPKSATSKKALSSTDKHDEKMRGEPPSLIEQVFLGKFPGQISRDLKQFGYDLFKKRASTFILQGDIPVNPDYIVGAGDSFTVNAWGSANFSHKAKVRRDGSIFIPKVGSIKVFGLSYDKMEQLIQRRVSNLYAGVKTSISFDTIRSIEVFVVGEVERPGSFSIPSTATPINALIYSGGPAKKGSLRNIQVLRHNKVIATVDLYDFLISGTASSVRLQSQDVILVPVVGQVAALSGNVKRPAIYEIKDKTSLFDAIQMAGGLSFTGNLGRLSLDRVEDNKLRVTRDFLLPENFKSITRELAIKTDLGQNVRDGDLIKIFPVLKTLNQTVFLKGYVRRPGPYEFKKGMTVKDLIPNYESLLPEPYTEYVQIIRTNPPKNERQSIFVNIRKIFEGDATANLSLQEKDEVFVFSKLELDLKEKVRITGRVNRPGEYNFFDGMRLKDLIFMAGNLTRDAYLASAEISRFQIVENDIKMNRIQVNLNDVLADIAEKNPVLEPRDQIYIQSIQNIQPDNFITLGGEVRYPGTYSFIPGEKVSNVLQRAGGFTTQAFLRGAIFTRESVRKFQDQMLKEQVNRLEQASLQEEVNPTKSFSAEDIQMFRESASSRKALLKNMRSVKATGRMIIQLDQLSEFRGGRYDITLESKDSLTIPAVPSAVTVMGEVYNQTSMVFMAGKNVQYYLDKAGGPTSNADVNSIIIIRSDGAVIARSQNKGFLLRNFYQTEIDRGDSILVPKDIARFSWLSTTKDLTDILFKIVTTTGITISAFR